MRHFDLGFSVSSEACRWSLTPALDSCDFEILSLSEEHFISESWRIESGILYQTYMAGEVQDLYQNLDVPLKA
jgi:hypothetical protein